MSSPVRRSKLAGLSPARPAPNTKSVKDAGGVDMTRKVQITVRVSQDVADRAREAWMKTMPIHRGSFSAWVQRAIERSIKQIELELNNGEVFEGLPAGSIPNGPINI